MALEASTTAPISEPHEKDIPSDAQAEETGTDESQTNTVAEQETEDTSQTSDEAVSEPEAQAEDNSEEAEIKDWAAKKNLPLDDPLKIAKMYREAEKELGRKGSQEGQLKKAVDTANSEAGVDVNQALSNRVAALEFYLEHPDARQYEPEMVKILEDKPWLAGDLEVVLDAAKGRASTDAERLAAERKAGRKEALTQAEKSGRAAPPRASATQSGYEGSGKITPQNLDAQIAAHNGDVKWYKEHQTEINEALAQL